MYFTHTLDKNTFTLQCIIHIKFGSTKWNNEDYIIKDREFGLLIDKK